jgi:hypothetical protein
VLQAAADAENLAGGAADVLSPLREFDAPDLEESDFPRDLTAGEQATLVRLLARTVSSVEDQVSSIGDTGTPFAAQAGPLLQQAAALLCQAWRALEEVPAATGIIPADGPEAKAGIDLPSVTAAREQAARTLPGRARTARRALARQTGRQPGRGGRR